MEARITFRRLQRDKEMRCPISFITSLALFAVEASAQNVDLVLERGFRSDVTIPIADLTRRSLEYEQVSYGLVGDYDFSARIANTGSDTAYGVVASVLVKVDGLPIGTYHSDTIANLVPGGVDTLVIPAGINFGVSQVELVFSVSSSDLDVDMTNNSDTVAIEISDDFHSRAYGEHTGVLGGVFGYRVATRYEMIEELTTCHLYCVVIADSTFGPGSDAIFIPMVFDQDLGTVWVGADNVITPADLSGPGDQHRVILDIANLTFQSNHDYFIGVEVWSFVDSLLKIATRGDSPPLSAAYYDEPSDTWSYLSETPMIGFGIEFEPQYSCPNAIQEFGTNSIPTPIVQPNPCDASAVLEWNTSRPQTLELLILNVNGELEVREQLGPLPTGSHHFSLDPASLSSGVYTCSLIGSDGTRSSQRLVVMH